MSIVKPLKNSSNFPEADSVWAFIIFLIVLLCVVLCTGCTVVLPDVRVCAVAGHLSNGADCAYSNSEDTQSLTFDETLDILEPQFERPDPKNPGKMLPERSGALIISAEDYTRLKTSLEQACKKLTCTKEMRKTLTVVTDKVERLSFRSLARRREKRP